MRKELYCKAREPIMQCGLGYIAMQKELNENAK